MYVAIFMLPSRLTDTEHKGYILLRTWPTILCSSPIVFVIAITSELCGLLTSIDGQIYFYRQPFLDPVKPWKINTDTVGLLRDMCNCSMAHEKSGIIVAVSLAYCVNSLVSYICISTRKFLPPPNTHSTPLCKCGTYDIAGCTKNQNQKISSSYRYCLTLLLAMSKQT